ncbi:MAG: hypothetical protein HKM07_01555 [Chlamydiae bacterium]|nr:hypothetical protein [Chlamydiota bacterium]
MRKSNISSKIEQERNNTNDNYPSKTSREKDELTEGDFSSTAFSLEDVIVDELNHQLAIVHTNTTHVLIEKSDTEFVLDSKSSILTLYENEVVEIDEKRKSKAQIWFKSPRRRTFKAIVFNPKIPGHYGENYNIWKGFSVEPIKGDCFLFWEHVRDIICCGKESHYLYVRKWLSHLVQKPWVIATALVLRGKQGTGKGIFVNTIGKLFGPHFAPLASLDQILGRFNSHLMNAILVFADEAIWGGNKKEIGALKSLITEPKLFIEAKGKDGFWIENFKHLIVSSNEAWVVHLDPDDRRFFVLDVSSDRKEDTSYFNAIISQLDNGGLEALMHDLLNEDLSGFDPKIMPENFAGFDMKLESAPSIDRFIYASLKEGCWDHANVCPSGEIKNLKIDDFYNNYKTWCERERQPILSKEQVGKRLRAIIPGMTTKRTPREEDRARPVIYIFPPIEECQGSFEKFYKQNSKIWDWS